MSRWCAGLAAALLVAAPAADAASARVRMRVVPQPSFADQPVHIRVSGLAPRAKARVRLTMRDAGGKLWESSATFRVDARGTVDLDRSAPRVGSYTGRWGMGLFASLDRDTRSPTFFRWKRDGGHTFRVGVRVRGKRVASRAFRRAMPGLVGEQPLSVADSGFLGRFYTPRGPGSPKPGILVLGGSEGGLVFPSLSRMLAANGYPTLGLAYFRAPGVPSTLANIPLEYFEKALIWLRAQPQVDPRHVVVIGISRGSEAAQLLGVHYPSLVSAVVAAVPSNVAICGFPDCSLPAWTVQGRPVPYTTQFSNPYPTDNPDAAIPVERIQGPIFLVCGALDTVWISCAYERAILDRLASFGHPYPNESHAYAHAGHFVGSLLPYLIVAPNELYLNAGDERAREAVWPHLLSFLARL